MSELIFAPPVSNPFGLTNVSTYASPTFIDIDGDGDRDAFIGNVNGDTLFYRNTGSVFVGPDFNVFGLIDVGLRASPSFADIDADGDLDAFVGNGAGNTVFFLNVGNASNAIFASPRIDAFGLINNISGYASPTFADIDGDGDLDAFIGNSVGNTLFFQNIGNAKNAVFVSSVANPFGLTDVGYHAAPSFTDIDGDGDLDAFIGNSVGNTLFFQNIGNANNAVFAAPVANPLGLTDVGNFANPTFVDIDGDGDRDAFIGGINGNTLFYLNNNKAPVLGGIFTTAGKVNDNATIKPFSGVTVADTEENHVSIHITYTATHGLLSGAGLNGVAGNYTLSLASLTTIQNELRTLVFHPKANQVAVGATVATTFTLTPNDGVAKGLANATTKVTAISINDAPVLSTPHVVKYTDTAFVDAFARVTGKLVGSDVDVGTTLIYGIAGGTNNGLTVSKSNAYGLLTVNKTTGAYSFVPNRAAIEPSGSEISNSALIVTVSDKGLPIKSDSAAFTIAIVQSGSTETKGNDTLIGTDGNDTFNALAGNDVIRGKLGADKMTGGSGNDAYYVDNTGDSVIETSTLTTEIDTVYSAISYTLTANVEKLILTGNTMINGTGNELNNVLIGNVANNILTGKFGADTLVGGLGKDTINLSEATAATDTVRIAAGDSVINNFDLVNNFKLGTGSVTTKGIDRLDLVNTHIAANNTGVNGVDAGAIHSHSINKGIISFDNVDTYSVPLTITAGALINVFNYLQANITGGNTVAFVAEGNSFVFQDNGANDTLVELVGVTAHSVNTTGLAAEAVWLV